MGRKREILETELVLPVMSWGLLSLAIGIVIG